MVTRAIVLGAGGPTGVAWEIGLLLGLAEAGVDVTAADLVVGTSAGAVVGAQLTAGADLEKLYADQVEQARARPDSDSSSASASGPAKGAVLALAWMVLRHRNPERYRVAVGKLALAADTMSEADWRSNFEGRLPVPAWPGKRLLITAVDAASGEFVAFDRDHGVSLVDAIAASTAVPGVWPPMSIGGRRFMDGGIRSCANADLAAGHDRVLIVAPIPRGSGPLMGAGAQAAELERGGARVTLVFPDRPARRAIGWNPMDWARKAAAAQAGRAQARTVASAVADAWIG